MMPPVAAFPALLALQGTGGVGSLTPFVIQLVAIFGIFYFLLIRPQQQQRRRHEETLRAVKRGDQVVTSGGIVGEVVHVREMGGEGKAAGMQDQLTIRSAESRLLIERAGIARVLSGTVAARE